MKPINPIPVLLAIIAVLLATVLILLGMRLSYAAQCQRGEMYRVRLQKCVSLTSPLAHFGAKHIVVAPPLKQQVAQTAPVDPPAANAPNWYSGFRWRTLTMEEASRLTDDELHAYGVEMLKHGQGTSGNNWTTPQ